MKLTQTQCTSKGIGIRPDRERPSETEQQALPAEDDGNDTRPRQLKGKTSRPCSRLNHVTTAKEKPKAEEAQTKLADFSATPPKRRGRHAVPRNKREVCSRKTQTPCRTSLQEKETTLLVMYKARWTAPLKTDDSKAAPLKLK